MRVPAGETNSFTGGPTVRIRFPPAKSPRLAGAGGGGGGAPDAVRAGRGYRTSRTNRSCGPGTSAAASAIVSKSCRTHIPSPKRQRTSGIVLFPRVFALICFTIRHVFYHPPRRNAFAGQKVDCCEAARCGPCISIFSRNYPNGGGESNILTVRSSSVRMIASLGTQQPVATRLRPWGRTWPKRSRN